MAENPIRRATFDDVQAICQLFRARVGVWQRLNAQGQVLDLPYDALTIYERWLHGDGDSNPWMSVETASLWMSHLLRGAGIPLVIEQDEQIVAYTCLYVGNEPDPYGQHLHIGRLVIHPDYPDAGLDDIIMQYLPEVVAEQRCVRLLVTCAGYDAESTAFYRRYGMKALTKVQKYSITAQTGQGFYKATEHLKADVAQIAGWYMAVGRVQSTHQHWEMLWPQHWQAIPQIERHKLHRLRFNISGQDALICFQQQVYQPRNADVYAWSPRPLTTQMLTAIRDWAHREGFRTLILALPDQAAPLLGSEVEVDPLYYDVYGVDV